MENLILQNVSEPYVLLAMAIVRQAACDYRIEYLKSMCRGENTPELERLERWFTSPWGQECSLGNGARVLKDLKADCALRYQYSYDRRDIVITHEDETKTLSEWAKSLGMGRTTLYNRLVRGWSIEDAITTPVRGNRRGKRKKAV